MSLTKFANPGGQDRAVEPQYRRDGAELCGEKGHIFINNRTGKRLTLRHFEKMIDKWGAEYPETSVHQAERQGIPSDHVNGTKEAGERHHDLHWR